MARKRAVSMVLALVAACLVSSTARAEPRSWEGAYERAQVVTAVGFAWPVAVLGVGLGVSVAILNRGANSASSTRDPAQCCASCFKTGVGVAAVALVVGALMPVGPMMVAGSSLRGRRAVSELYGTDVPQWPGYLSWGLAAGAVGWLFTLPAFEDDPAPPLALAGAFLSASYIFGAVQWAKNGSNRGDVTVPLLAVSLQF